MGADQSALAKAEAAGIQDAEDAMQQGYEEAKREDQARSLKRKAVEDAAPAGQPSTFVSDVELGEVMEWSADPITVPLSSNNSSQPSPGPSDILATFNPRKEREPKKAPGTSYGMPTEEDFVGFGNKQPNKRKAAKVASPDTTSDSITVSRRLPPTASRKSSTDSRPSTSSAKESLPAKRPTTEADPTKQKLSLSTLPKIQKRTSIASPQSPDRAVGEQLLSTVGRQPPKWYRDTQVSGIRNRGDGGIDVILSSLRDAIAKPSRSLQKHELQKAFELVRDKLHTIIFQEVNPQVLKRHRTMHNDAGLPQVFDEQNNGVKWPYDIRADAKELYNKYYRQDFGTDMMRGIKFTLSLNGKRSDGGDSIDQTYSKNVLSAKKHGNNGLVNGQWWPFQICALRDGAHGVIQGGIFGTVGEGAYSCIMSGGEDSQRKPYPDQDDGEEVLYCGTDSKDGEVTAYTQRMIESVNGKPVRLLRSHNAKTKYSPEEGFRYDGLYHVTSVERIDSEESLRQRHRFKLVRVEGQDPIRGGSGPEKRPTFQEIEEYKNHQRLSGKKGQSSSKGN